MTATLQPLDAESRRELLANTYSDGKGWQRVQDYRRVTAYQDANPDDGPTAAADALGLDRDYLHGWWYTDSRPTALTGLETADEHGWLDCQPGDRVFEALSVLHAWVLAGGSVSTAWQPHWVLTDRPRDLLEVAVDAVDVGGNIVHEDDDTGPVGLVPAQDAFVLGRFLVGVLDAPQGTKIHADLRIPAWLASCPRATRRRWARTFVSVRGVPLSHGPGRQIREAERPDGYHDALVALFRDVVDDTDGLSQGTDAIYLRGAVCDALDVVPELPE